MDWAIWVTKGGGSFKSLTVLLANTTTSESGSTIMNQCFFSNIMIKIKKIYKNGSKWNNNNNNTRRVPSEGILVSMTVDFNVESNGYEIFRSWPVYLFLIHYHYSLIHSFKKERRKERKELTSWTWQGFCRKQKQGFSSSIFNDHARETDANTKLISELLKTSLGD